jgi:hypothetical protein
MAAFPLGLENNDAMCHLSATSEIASGSKLGIEATKRLRRGGLKRPGRR